MNPKRELTSVDLAALATELKRYEGAKVDKAYLYGDDLLRLKMRDFERGRVELVVEVGDRKRAHTVATDRIPDAPGRPPQFAMMLRNRIESADLVDVRQYEFDRILVFEFERPDQDTTIVCELFGDGNVAVLDENGAVVQSLETVRLKSRTVAPGSQYQFPESRLNPLDVSYDVLEARMEQSDTDVVRTVATQLNLGGLWGEELCARAGVEKTMAIDEAGPEQYERLHEELMALADALRSGQFDPRIYFEGEDDPAESDDGDEEAGGGERVVDVTPVPLDERSGLPSEPFDSFNAALDDYFHRLERQAEPGEEEVGERTRPDFEAEVAKQQRIIDQQERAIEDFEEEAQEYRRKAELCYERYDLVDDVLTTVRDAREQGRSWDEIEETLAAGAEQGIPAAEAVVDVNSAEGTVTVELDDERVELDVSTGVEKNADRLYREAKRVEEKMEGAREAIEDTRERLEAVKQRREEWEEGEREEAAEEPAEPREVDWLAKSDIPVRQPEHWFERFRWFHTSDGYLVIGGRNADQNEEIVKKYLGKHDRFFHSEAHGGPATVLKASGPSEPSNPVDFPETSLREAAQFAVSYSSVWKDGRYADDAYMVEPDQVSKTPESGEFIEKGGFVIRGDREYYRDVESAVAVGIVCEDETRVIGGPPAAIEPRAESSIRLRPGKFAQNDIAVKCYREFKERFADESFVRKVASADRIQEFLPPGGSEMAD